MQSLQLMYHQHMLEVKQRFKAIERILGAKKGKPRTLSEDYDSAFIWLQLRMIVELVAYASIAADKERYAALRRKQHPHAQFEKDGRAGKILEHLSKINPKFLPQALGGMVVGPDGKKHFEGLPEEQRATRERLVAIHELASEHLHAMNPFDDTAQASGVLLSRQSRSSAEREYRYLKSILAEHYKIGLEYRPGDDPESLDDPKHAWIVVLGSSKDASGIQMIQAESRPVQAGGNPAI